MQGVQASILQQVSITGNKPGFLARVHYKVRAKAKVKARIFKAKDSAVNPKGILSNALVQFSRAITLFLSSHTSIQISH